MEYSKQCECDIKTCERHVEKDCKESTDCLIYPVDIFLPPTVNYQRLKATCETCAREAELAGTHYVFVDQELIGRQIEDMYNTIESESDNDSVSEN